MQILHLINNQCHPIQTAQYMYLLVLAAATTVSEVKIQKMKQKFCENKIVLKVTFVVCQTANRWRYLYYIETFSRRFIMVKHSER